MLAEIGHFSLILGFCFAVLLALLPLYAGQRNHPVLLKMTTPIVIGQFIFCLVSYAILTYAFLVNDFSLSYVANNSSIELPFAFRFSAVWGAHEGSMLLWILILSLWTLAVALFSQSLPKDIVARVVAVMGWISAGFIIFVLATSNPFLRFLPEFPENGVDLNPLLQDPGLLIHPPMLYLGYVGFVVPFAFALACLIAGRIDAQWARWTRPWTLIAWCFLTMGIVLGSWWAYRVLGWGGWWFWDPVENASFMPWLVGTALLHSLLVTEKRNAFRAWTVLLAISAFVLSLLGAFLVRSGVLTSVHAFAVDPTRGVYMLGFLLFVVGVSFLLYAWRANQLRAKDEFALLSRESMLMLNNVFLIVIMLTILLGTLYPLFIEALGFGKLSVGAPYFNKVFVPLILPFLFLMGLGPHATWREMPLKQLILRLRYLLPLSVVLGISLPWLYNGEVSWPAVGLSLALWIVFTTLADLRQRQKKGRGIARSIIGMAFAHIGVAVCLVGITFTTTLSIERDVRMKPGDNAQLGAYQFIFKKIDTMTGPNYHGLEASFTVLKNGKSIKQLQSYKKIYNIREFAMTDAAISPGLFSDLYVALGEQISDTDWSVRLYVKPFVRWIWLGGILMMLGGFIAATDRHYFRRREKK